MTTRLRHVGAAIMGILDPIPSNTPSPMGAEEGAWVRANAWTKHISRIDGAYPHGFHRWCACEYGICSNCMAGAHDTCNTVEGPRRDRSAGTITDREGFVVAIIVHRDDQVPCRRICPCTHDAADPSPGRSVPAARTARRAHNSASVASAGQIGLFDAQSVPD